MMRRLFGKAKTDDGVALLLIAVSMTFIIGMAALSIDLGALRGDIRADRLAADAAVTAGVAAIDPFSGSDARQACEVAWDYLLLNLDDEGTSVSPPNCALLGGACTPSVAREATWSATPPQRAALVRPAAETICRSLPHRPAGACVGSLRDVVGRDQRRSRQHEFIPRR